MTDWATRSDRRDKRRYRLQVQQVRSTPYGAATAGSRAAATLQAGQLSRKAR